jgi:hypothetical protein
MPAPKPKVAPKAVVNAKIVAAQPSSKKLVVAPHPTTSPLEGISDLDELPLKACVELTHRLLTSIPSLLMGVARPRAVLKAVMLFVAEFGSTP